MKTIASTIEALESRIAPAGVIFTVTTLKDITDSLHDTGSLRDAIFKANAANNGNDTIVFQKAVGGSPLTGTIKLNSDLPAITDGLTITGPKHGKANGIIIDGNKHQIFNIATTSGDVAFTDLTVMHGQAQSGPGFSIHDIASRTVALTDVTVSGNHAITTTPGATVFGGGIDIEAASKVTISKSKISGNFSTGIAGDATHVGGYAYGGAIDCRGTLTISQSVISGNTVQGGKGLAGSGRAGGTAYGGGVYCSGAAADVTIENSTVTLNKSLGGSGGGGAKGQKGGAGGVGNGGGVYNFDGKTRLTDCVISKNTAKGGNGGAGGKGGDGGDGTDTWGGGIVSSSVTTPNTTLTTIAASTISGNTVTGGKGGSGGGAGAIHGAYGGSRGGGVFSSETLDISDSTISGNSSALFGAGLYIRKGAATIEQSTIAKNKASRDGGGITITGGTVKIHNSTIAQNKTSATNGFGGGLDVSDANSGVNLEIVSSIIAGNSAKTDAEMTCSFNVGKVNVSFSLIQHVTIGTVFTDGGGNVNGVDPLLGALASNGGPTQTILPKAGSPVIGKGSNPDMLTADQRGIGFVRTLGAAIDIGAVEVS